MGPEWLTPLMPSGTGLTGSQETCVYTPNMSRTWLKYFAPISMLLALLASACAPPGVAKAAMPALPEPLRETPYPHESVAVHVSEGSCDLDGASAAAGDWSPRTELRGDPDFDPDELPPAVRCWYEVLWNSITDPERAEYFTRRAASGDLYYYAREINNHLVALLTAFRLTGDLAFLDEVDRLAEHMRSRLEDTWKGRYALMAGSTDGYLNWVWDQDHSDEHRGRDINEIDEIRTHSGVAQLAYVFAANADLESPNGVDYAERASFWSDYLLEHFEPKWRERNDVPWPEMPFLQRNGLHGNVEFVRYHHYMYLLTGEEVYAAEARRLSERAYANFVEVQAEGGPALVSTRGVMELSTKLDQLLPSIYFRHVIASAVDLYFEGVAPWDDEVMTKLARSLSEFILDGKGDGFARDIGGGVARAGIEPASTDFNRIRSSVYNVSPFAMLAAWDATGEVAETSVAVHLHRGQDEWNVFIPTGLLMQSAFGSLSFAAN